jgi:hypothetical protein
VGFEYQLGFLEFCYDLAHAFHAKKHVPAQFLRKWALFGQNTKFSSSIRKIFPRTKNCFSRSKVYKGLNHTEKGGYQPKFEKVLFQATLRQL